MTLTRRLIGQVLGLGPLLALTDPVNTGNPAPPNHPYPSVAAVGGSGASTQALGQRVRQMTEEAALAKIKSDPVRLDLIRDAIRQELSQSPLSALDPDIAVMRSWSRMAKVTFQRQRNVEARLQAILCRDRNSPSDYIAAFHDYLSDLIWGKEMNRTEL